MMKALALLIVTVNIVFFLWEYHFGALSSENASKVSESTRLQPILLVSEVRQKLEDKALWQAKAVTERNPFVSEYLLTRLGSGRLESGNRQLLVEDFEIAPRPRLLDQAKADRTEHSEFTTLARTAAQNAIAVRARPLEPADRQESQPENVPPVPALTATPKEALEQPRREAQSSVVAARTDDDVGQVPPVEAVKAEPLSACYEAGPFENKAQLEQWRRLSGIAAAFVSLVRRDEPKITGYQVYYPAPDTFEEALANVEMLKKRGITDLWLFRKGELKGEISLGLFKNNERAEKLESQLKSQGLDVNIKPRLKNAIRWYARIKIAPELEDNLIASRDPWRERHSEFAIKVSRDCIETPDSAHQ